MDNRLRAFRTSASLWQTPNKLTTSYHTRHPEFLILLNLCKDLRDFKKLSILLSKISIVKKTSLWREPSFSLSFFKHILKHKWQRNSAYSIATYVQKCLRNTWITDLGNNTFTKYKSLAQKLKLLSLGLKAGSVCLHSMQGLPPKCRTLPQNVGKDQLITSSFKVSVAAMWI